VLVRGHQPLEFRLFLHPGEGRILRSLPLQVRVQADGFLEGPERAPVVPGLCVALRERIEQLVAVRVDVERLLLLGDGLGELAFACEPGGGFRQAGVHAEREVQQPPELLERIGRIVDADVDDALDGRRRVGRKRPDHQEAGRLHAARIAALGLAGVECVHQALGHRPLAGLVGGGHGLEDVLARQRVALDRKAPAGDVAGVTAEMNEIRRIGIAVDHAFAGVHRRSTFGVDDRHLARVPSRVLVGDALDDLLRRESLLEERDGLGSVLAVRRCLRGDRANARLGERDRRAGGERSRLNADAQLVRSRIERDDREGGEPRVGGDFLAAQRRRVFGARGEHQAQEQQRRPIWSWLLPPMAASG
jgi:hypothetical protein